MKDIIKLHDRKFKIMIPAEKIDEAVAAVAKRINEITPTNRRRCLSGC